MSHLVDIYFGDPELLILSFFLVMTQEEDFNAVFNPARVTELLKLLQRGEMTADSMEERLDALEKELETMMEKLEGHESGDNSVRGNNDSGQDSTNG